MISEERIVVDNILTFIDSVFEVYRARFAYDLCYTFIQSIKNMINTDCYKYICSYIMAKEHDYDILTEEEYDELT